MATLILLNKPYQVLSQFTDAENRKTLSSYITQSDVYPAGRLDYDSEGLLLLTDDGALQHQISHPKHKLPKTYWVQVEGEVNLKAIDQLKQGVDLKDGKTKTAKARVIDSPKAWARQPAVRERKHIPTTWLEITISEGRNRQVRRMTAAVGFPTLRLIRISIGHWKLGDLAPGAFSTQSVHMPKTYKNEHKTNRKK